MINKIFNFVFIAFFIFSICSCAFQKPDYLQLVSSAELNTILQNEDIFLVDVHTPEQKHIQGTDLFIPYNQVEKHQDKLPIDKNTAIYLYCESGPMGNAAARSLHNLGYINIFNLEGGANAWRKSGYQFK